MWLFLIKAHMKKMDLEICNEPNRLLARVIKSKYGGLVYGAGRGSLKGVRRWSRRREAL